MNALMSLLTTFGKFFYPNDWVSSYSNHRITYI